VDVEPKADEEKAEEPNALVTGAEAAGEGAANGLADGDGVDAAPNPANADVG
jgi:hypothetical protein